MSYRLMGVAASDLVVGFKSLARHHAVRSFACEFQHTSHIHLKHRFDSIVRRVGYNRCQHALPSSKGPREL